VASYQFSLVEHTEINVVLALDTSRLRNKVCSLKTALLTNDMLCDM